MMEEYDEMQLIYKDLQLELLKGNLNWEDDKIQFFLPVALHFTDFDWLKLIAENTLVEEDEKIVKNFLSMAESLKEINGSQLDYAVAEKIRKLFGE